MSAEKPGLEETNSLALATRTLDAKPILDASLTRDLALGVGPRRRRERDRALRTKTTLDRRSVVSALRQRLITRWTTIRNRNDGRYSAGHAYRDSDRTHTRTRPRGGNMIVHATSVSTPHPERRQAESGSVLPAGINATSFSACQSNRCAYRVPRMSGVAERGCVARWPTDASVHSPQGVFTRGEFRTFASRGLERTVANRGIEETED